MEVILTWACGHPLLTLFLVVAAFVLWLAAPVTWRDGEGDSVESSETLRDWCSGLLCTNGSLWLWVIGRGTRSR